MALMLTTKTSTPSALARLPTGCRPSPAYCATTSHKASMPSPMHPSPLGSSLLVAALIAKSTTVSATRLTSITSSSTTKAISIRLATASSPTLVVPILALPSSSSPRLASIQARSLSARPPHPRMATADTWMPRLWQDVWRRRRRRVGQVALWVGNTQMLIPTGSRLFVRNRGQLREDILCIN